MAVPSNPRNELLILLGMTLLACETSGPELGEGQFMSWEDFRAVSPYYETANGRRYFVQEDLPIGDEEALHAYYESVLAGDAPKEEFRSVGNLLDDETTRDIWDPLTKLELTYCVQADFNSEEWTNFSTGEGAPSPYTITDPYENAVATMETATRRWELAANLRFTHLEAEDGNCDHNNPNILFSVRPWTSGGTLAGCAFYPNDTTNKEPCDENLGFVRTLWLGGRAIRDGTDSRVTLHEIGHMLGLRHERAHPDRDPMLCGPDNDGVPGYLETLTDFDLQSVMLVTNQSCRDEDWDYSVLSPLDGRGIRKLYGMPVSWMVAGGVL
jgi:hypothetical protein